MGWSVPRPSIGAASTALGSKYYWGDPHLDSNVGRCRLWFWYGCMFSHYPRCCLVGFGGLWRALSVGGVFVLGGLWGSWVLGRGVGPLALVRFLWKTHGELSVPQIPGTHLVFGNQRKKGQSPRTRLRKNPDSAGRDFQGRLRNAYEPARGWQPAFGQLFSQPGLPFWSFFKGRTGKNDLFSTTSERKEEDTS